MFYSLVLNALFMEHTLILFWLVRGLVQTIILWKISIIICSLLQFHRVLSELELGGLVNALEFGILYRKFDVKVGGSSDVNYIAFCEMCDTYAQTKWSEPSLN